MWRVERTTPIEVSIDKVWDVLITPGLWMKVDPVHYEDVKYNIEKLQKGEKGKMKTKDSPGFFTFKTVDVNDENHVVITESGTPLGVLTITKRLNLLSKNIELEESVVATGPFAKTFAKLFFQKQIADTLPSQHATIKQFVEKRLA